MNKKIKKIMVLSILTCLLFTKDAFSDCYIVVGKEDSNLNEIFDKYNIDYAHIEDDEDTYNISIRDTKNEDKYIKKIIDTKKVQYITKLFSFKNGESKFNHPAMNEVEEIFDKGIDGEGTTFVVIDGGFKIDPRFYKKDDLSNDEKYYNKQIPCIISGNNENFKDYDLHGTEIFQILSLDSENYKGIAKGAKFNLLSFVSDKFNNNFQDFRNVLSYSKKINPDIITMSVRMIYPDTDEYKEYRKESDEIIKDLYDNGINIFSGISNNYVISTSLLDPKELGYPASYEKVIAVNNVKTSILHNYFTTVTLSKYNDWGPNENGFIKPDICAIGTNVHTFDASNHYYAGGTSYSVPNASGTYSLILNRLNNDAEFAKLTKLEKSQLAKQLLLSTSSPIYSCIRNIASPRGQGYGVINPLSAINSNYIAYPEDYDGSGIKVLNTEDGVIEFSIVVENIGDKTGEFNISVLSLHPNKVCNIISDTIRDVENNITVTSNKSWGKKVIKDIDNEIKIKPNEKKTLDIKITVDKKLMDELKAKKVKYIDGFVNILPLSDNGGEEQLSVPYCVKVCW